MTRILLAALLTFLSLKVMGKSLQKQCIELLEIETFKKYGPIVIKGCMEIHNYDRDYCYEEIELERFKKYGVEVIKSCLESHGNDAYYCDEDVELVHFKNRLDLIKKYGAELINRCTLFHGNVSSMCDTDEQLTRFSELAPYIESCRSALGNACTDCSSVEGIKRFLNGEISKESVASNYFNIAEFFDIAVEPACAVYQLELRPQYEKYVKKAENDLNRLVQCEVQSTKNNLMVKELQKLSERMINDIKYVSLYKASLTNEKIKDVFLDFVKGFAKESKLLSKAQISDTGISYADAEIEIGLSFKDTVDNENNKQSMLQLKSLQCEKKYPPQKMLSYEEYRNKELPPNCLKFSFKKEKMKSSSNADKVKDKAKDKADTRKPQTTKF